MADADTSNMHVFKGLFCCNTLVNPDFQSFIGCTAVNECLCIREECCVKMNTPLMPCIIGAADGFILKVGLPCCSIGLKVPTICMKAKSQCFCLTSNVAIPPDEDTPLMLAIMGIMCFPVFGVCMKMSAVPKK